MSLALPKTFRIVAQNSIGQVCDNITVKALLDRPSPVQGQVDYSTELTLLNADNTASAGFANGTTMKNDAGQATTNGGGWYGAAITASVTANTAAPSGTVNFFLETSTDGGTTWPTAGQGKLLGSITITGASATPVKKNFFL